MVSKFLECKEGPRCVECPLYSKGIPVSDRMPDAANWSGLSVIGELPGRDEVKTEFRRVFVGQSGKFVDKLETMIGRNDAHVTNAIRCGLPYGAKPSYLDMFQAAECCKPLVVHNLKFLGTTCALHLGATSMFIYMGVGKFDKSKGFSGIETFRGTCLPPVDNEPWIATCTIHPAAVIREAMAALKVEFVGSDWKKAYELALGETKIWEPDVRDQSDVSGLLAFLEEAHESAKMFGTPIALDVETFGETKDRAVDALSCDLRTVGVATNHKTYSIPWQDFYEYYDPRDWVAIYKALERILEDPDVPTLYHNKIFDVPVLKRHFPKGIHGTRHDTLVMHHCIYPKVGHELQSVASHFLAPEPWKSDYKAGGKKGDIWTTRNEDPEEFLNLLWYNALDALATWEVYQIMKTQLVPWGVHKVYENDVVKQDCATDWFENGIPINREEAEKQRVSEDLAIKEQLTELQMMVAEEVKDPEKLGLVEFVGPAGKTMVQKKIGFNPRSADQMRAFLFDHLGLVPVSFTRKQMKASVARDVLWEMRMQHPFLEKYLAYKVRADDYSRYLKNLSSKLHIDGRLHPVWKPHSTPSGRFGVSPNVQGWTVDMLDMMEAPEGYLFIGADFSMLEVRVVAALAPEWPLINAIRDFDNGVGEDIHRRNAKLYYAEIWEQAEATGDKKLQKKLRDNGKPVTFLMNYMGSDDAAYEAIKQDRPDENALDLRKEAIIMRARYLQHHPAIVEAADFYHEYANAHYELRSAILHRMRRWPLGNAKPTDTANMPVQSTAADIMDAGTIRWRESMEADGVYQTVVFPNLHIHDAIFALCKIEHAERERQRLEECLSCELTISSPVTGEEVTQKYPAEAVIGRTVKDVKINRYEDTYKSFLQARKLLKRRWTEEHHTAIAEMRKLGLRLRPRS